MKNKFLIENYWGAIFLCIFTMIKKDKQQYVKGI